MIKKFDCKGSIILGMHDAIVSLTGLIAGLGFALHNTVTIILSCIIASVTAGLSMGAANYLAVKTTNKNYALHAAFYTGFAYIITCILLIFPFFIFSSRIVTLVSVFLMALYIIFFFNFFFYRRQNFYKNFSEMLIICTLVSIISFFIGFIGKYFLEM